MDLKTYIVWCVQITLVLLLFVPNLRQLKLIFDNFFELVYDILFYTSFIESPTV